MSNKIYLSRRNLLTLLNKLDRAAKDDETARMIIKRDRQHAEFPSTPTEIVAVEDDAYYTDRSPGPTQEIEMMMTQIPWLQVIDEAMVVLHCGVVNPSDSYAVARKKLADLICLEIQSATDPAVNGGFSLQPVVVATLAPEPPEATPLVSAEAQASSWRYGVPDEAIEFGQKAIARAGYFGEK